MSVYNINIDVQTRICYIYILCRRLIFFPWKGKNVFSTLQYFHFTPSMDPYILLDFSPWIGKNVFIIFFSLTYFLFPLPLQQGIWCRIFTLAVYFSAYPHTPAPLYVCLYCILLLKILSKSIFLCNAVTSQSFLQYFCL